MEDVPILMSSVYYDKNMNKYLYDVDSEYSKAVNDYFYMEYNNLQKDRQQQFFDAFPEEAHKDDLEKKYPGSYGQETPGS